MDAREFLDNFEHIASAPNGVRRLRELILQLAVQGHLVEQIAHEEPASSILERCHEKKVALIKKGRIFDNICSSKQTYIHPPLSYKFNRKHSRKSLEFRNKGLVDQS